MSATGFSTLDKTVHKTKQILKEIEHAQGWSKDRRNWSYDALRAVLHALRRYVAEGEWEDIKSSISQDLRPLIPV